MPLKSAVVGAGVVSRTHLTGLNRNPRTELVAICDLDAARARETASEFGIDAFTELPQMLAERDLDWIHVCTPVQTHLELSRTAIKAGVPVLVEKPVTETVEQVMELESVAEQHGVHASVVHQHLFDPAMREVRRRIRDRQLGDIRGVDLIYTGLTAPDVQNRGAWTTELPGGEFEEGLPHPIYLVLALGGYPASEDVIQAHSSLSGTYEEGFDYDSAHAQYVCGDGALCSLTLLSGTTPQRLIHIYGEERSVTVDMLSQTVVDLDRDYAASSLNRARNNIDRAADRMSGTIDNGLSVARRKFDSGWEAQKRLNPHYYQFDEEAELLEAGDRRTEPLERARWTISILDQIRSSSDPGGTRRMNSKVIEGQ